MKKILKCILAVICLVFTVTMTNNSLKAQGKMYCEWSPAVCQVVLSICPDGSHSETRIMGILKIPFQQ